MILLLKGAICSADTKCLKSVLHSKFKILESVVCPCPLFPRLEANTGCQVEDTNLHKPAQDKLNKKQRRVLHYKCISIICSQTVLNSTGIEHVW